MLATKEGFLSFTVVIIIAILLHVTHTLNRRGFVEEYFINRKFTCAGKRKFNTASEIQCVHHCLRNENCGIANYKEGAEEKLMEHNCEVYDVSSHHESCSSVYDNGWKSLVFTRKIKTKVYKSCKDIALDQPGAASGAYELEDGSHFCRIGDIPDCGSGGWTLALKINGSKSTFTAEKDLWVNNVTFNVKNGMKSFYNEEAKFNAFSTLSFDSTCIGMKYSGTTKWLRIGVKGSSLRDIFHNGNYIQTSISRDKWKSLIIGSSLQVKCNRQGFNVMDTGEKIYARIGYIGNQENNCNSPDSFIALGGSTSFILCSISHLAKISCGNFASCSPDNGDKSLPAMGFILVQ